MPLKCFLVKDFLQLHHADICCLQKSKLSTIDLTTWRSIGGPRLDKFSFIPAIGSAGGIFIGWNNSLFDGKLIFKGMFSLTLEFTNKNTRVFWVCTTVYGPNIRQLKQQFWDEIRHFSPHPSLPWVICGDFNSIFDPTDKLNGSFHREDI